MRAILKMTWRSAGTFFGRYMALLLIVAISVGFFAGLKITTDAMLNTGEIYLNEQNFYDYRLFSTLGFTEDDVKAFSSLDGVEMAEGTKSTDVLMDYEGNKKAFTLMSLTEKINLPSLVSGRIPTAKNECLADSKHYDEDDIGTTVYFLPRTMKAWASRLTVRNLSLSVLRNLRFTLALTGERPISATARCSHSSTFTGMLF